PPAAAALLAVLAVAIAAVAVVAVLRRPVGAVIAAPAPDLGPAFALLRSSVDELRSAQASALGELRAEFQRTLGSTEQQLVTQTTATQRQLADVSRQLGALGEQSTRIGDLAKDIGSLQDLLRAPKPRGGFGELMLERLLADCLPAGAYETQFTYRDGSRVDAIVHSGGRIVPIDAKFPNESYTQVGALGIRGLAMQERTRDLQQGIAQVRREFERFVELHDQLGRHLDNATKKFDETDRALARASGAIEGLAQVPLAAGGEQGVLPLGLPTDDR